MNKGTKDKNPVGYHFPSLRKDRMHVRNMINHVRTFIEENVPAGDTICVSCSAGIDSMCLADILYRVYRISERNPVCVLHVNHGLRPMENPIEHDLIASNCKEKGLDSHILDGKINKGVGLQDRARSVRYKAIFDFASKANVKDIFVAHNKNDVVEGMMIKLFQGRIDNSDGQFKVYGLKPNHNIGTFTIFRPLLSFTRKDVERYMKTMNLKWHEDSSNKTDDYLRNYIRHNVIPKTFLA